MTTLGEELLTVGEAAGLIRVSQSTIWRWINSGHLLAVRVGPKRVMVKQGDLDALVRPARPQAEAPELERQPRLTPAEQQHLAAALEDAARFRAKLLSRRGGLPFGPAWEEISGMRDERTGDRR